MVQKIAHYEILRKLGEGGMGEVFEAVDTKLGRKVAVKILREEFRADRGRVKRFIREARSAAVLSHENLCTIYEAGESDDGVPYIGMEFVEGQTLADRINGAPMDPDDILAIGLQAADALHEAHTKGIVHRDIKPGNIMITPSGVVKVLDFGLAKRLFFPAPDRPILESEGSLTLEGLVVGTLPYMSPEQLHGKKVDHRSDLFSFGITLYEMCTGSLPYSGTTQAGLIGEILHTAPASPLSLNPKIPRRLDQAISKALEKEPELRHQSALEIKSELLRARRDSTSQSTEAVKPGRRDDEGPSDKTRGFPMWRLAVAAVVVLTMAGLAWYFLLRPNPPLPDDLHVILLPDEEDGTREADRILSRGMTSFLVHELTGMQKDDERLTVDPEPLPDPVGGAPREKTPELALRELGSTLAVKVAFRRTPGSNRLTLSLVDTGTLSELGRVKFEDPAGNLTSWQEQAPQRLATLLGVRVSERKLAGEPGGRTSIPAAFELLLQGAGNLWFTHDGERLDKAISYYSDAVAQDPGYDLAFLGRGSACWRKYRSTGAESWLSLAKADLGKAAGADGGISDAHSMLGSVLRATGKLEEAEAELRKALAANPADLEAIFELARVYGAMGKDREAEDRFQKAAFLRPRYGRCALLFGLYFWGQSDYLAAANQFRRLAELTPDNVRAFVNLGSVYYQLERWDDARRSWEDSVKIEPTVGACSNLGALYFDEGRFADAASMFEKAVALDAGSHWLWGHLAMATMHVAGKESETLVAVARAAGMAEEELQADPAGPDLLADLANYHSMMEDEECTERYLGLFLQVVGNDATHMFTAATIYAQLGKTDESLEWLDNALVRGYPVRSVERGPAFKDLRADPRFRELLKRYQAVNP